MRSVMIHILGKIYLTLKRAGDIVETKNIKKKLLKCGNNVFIGSGCNIIPEHVSIGNNVSIGYGASLMASIANIFIGNNVMIAPGVVIRGGIHRYDIIGKRMNEVKDTEKLPENDQDVYIDDDVWIGQNAIILKGVHIGEGAIVGAGAVVTKDIAPYTIHIGVHEPKDLPRFTAEQIKEHKMMLNKQMENIK